MSFFKSKKVLIPQKMPKVNRFRQMCNQQQLIEEKRRAITAKMESKKREAEEAKLKSETPSDSTSCEMKRANNMFSNDGSFLEQFKKLTEVSGNDKVKIEPKLEIKTEEIKKENIFKGSKEESKEACKTIFVPEVGSINPSHESSQPVPPVIKAEPNEACVNSIIPEKTESPSSQKDRGTKRKSRWGMKEARSPVTPSAPCPVESASSPPAKIPGLSGALLTKVTKRDKGLLQYAMTAYGSTDLSDEDWKKAEDNYKVHLLYQDMLQKRAEVQRLHAMGKNKYEYDSDEETDGGTWEHKAREKEMVATAQWADQLTEMAKGKHHIGDFLPPEELKKFMDKFQSIKGGEEPDLSDYKEFKLTEENKGFQMLQKLGWNEGQGLGADGSGIVEPLNKARNRDSNMGLGVERPDDLTSSDDEYDAYRKRMMLAYRFRPNPLNNPRRPYY